MQSPDLSALPANAADIPLWRGPCAVTLDGEEAPFEGTLKLSLAPDVRVFVEGAFEGAPAGKLPNAMRSELPLRIGDSGAERPVLIESLQIGSRLIATFSAQKADFAIRAGGERQLASQTFHLLNFPRFRAPGKPSAMILRDGDWRIEIAATPATEATMKSLKTQGGNGVTHAGTLARADGGAFGEEEARIAMTRLQYILSFASGRWVAPLGIVGRDAYGRVVLQDWTERMGARWMEPMNWPGRELGRLLPEAYPHLAAALADPQRGKGLRRVIHWYLQANVSGDDKMIDGNLVLGQAALEMLARLASELRGASTGGNAGTRIRNACKACGVPVQAPAPFAALLDLIRANGWEDGVRAIVEIRNSFAHPHTKLHPSRDALAQAWMFSQQCVELLILSLAGYSGSHADRGRAAVGDFGAVMPVPWAHGPPPKRPDE